MPTIRKLLREGTQYLTEAKIEAAALDARLLLQHVLGIPHEALVRHHTQLVKKTATQEYKRLLERRAKHEPVACIMGRKEFWSLPFKTTKDTLDPRPDSETLIEAALKHASSPMHILDLGTGTGCLLLALLHEFSETRGIGVDCSQAALDVAQENAQRLRLIDRVSFVQGEWTQGISSTFDLVVSNPPYIPANDLAVLAADVREYDPLEALDGGGDGLNAYRTLIPQVPDLLVEDGLLLLEIGQGQEDAVCTLLEEAGLTVKEQVKDLAGIIRCIVAHKGRV